MVEGTIPGASEQGGGAVGAPRWVGLDENSQLAVAHTAEGWRYLYIVTSYSDFEAVFRRHMEDGDHVTLASEAETCEILRSVAPFFRTQLCNMADTLRRLRLRQRRH